MIVVHIALGIVLAILILLVILLDIYQTIRVLARRQALKVARQLKGTEPDTATALEERISRGQYRTDAEMLEAIRQGVHVERLLRGYYDAQEVSSTSVLPSKGVN